MPANFDKIKQCKLVKILGVTECNDCENLAECWGQEAVLPEPSEKGLEDLAKVLEDSNAKQRQTLPQDAQIRKVAES